MNEPTPIIPAVIEPSKEWIERRDSSLAMAATFDTIESGSQAEAAMQIVAEMGKLGKALKEARLKVTRRYDEAKRKVMNHEKELALTIDAERDRLKAIATKYITEQKRIQAEERRRQEERAAQQAMDEAAMQDAAAAFGFDVEAMSARTAVDIPAKAEAKVAGARVVTRYDWEVMNPAEVPHELCSVDPRKVRAHIDYCRKMGRHIAIPGIMITARESVESR